MLTYPVHLKYIVKQCLIRHSTRKKSGIWVYVFVCFQVLFVMSCQLHIDVIEFISDGMESFALPQK